MYAKPSVMFSAVLGGKVHETICAYTCADDTVKEPRLHRKRKLSGSLFSAEKLTNPRVFLEGTELPEVQKVEIYSRYVAIINTELQIPWDAELTLRNIWLNIANQRANERGFVNEYNFIGTNVAHSDTRIHIVVDDILLSDVGEYGYEVVEDTPWYAFDAVINVE